MDKKHIGGDMTNNCLSNARYMKQLGITANSIYKAARAMVSHNRDSESYHELYETAETLYQTLLRYNDNYISLPQSNINYDSTNEIRLFQHINRGLVEMSSLINEMKHSDTCGNDLVSEISSLLREMGRVGQEAYNEYRNNNNQIKEIKMTNNNQKIKLSENQLKQIIEESVKQVLNEGNGHFFDNMKGAWEGAKTGYHMRKAANAGQDDLKYFNKEQARSGKSSTKVLQCFENISKIVEGLRMYWGKKRWLGNPSTDYMFREINEIYRNLNVIKAIIRTPSNSIDYFDDEIQYTHD